MFKTKGCHRSGDSDDDARYNQLKLDTAVKLDGPVDEQVEILSNQKRGVRGKAQTGAA
jgi:hypothetical protein